MRDMKIPPVYIIAREVFLILCPGFLGSVLYGYRVFFYLDTASLTIFPDLLKVILA